MKATLCLACLVLAAGATLAADVKPLKTLAKHEEAVHSVAFSPDGKALASGSWDGTVILWEVSSGKRIATFHGRSVVVESITVPIPIDSVAFTPDGKTLAATGASGTVDLWDVATRKKTHALQSSDDARLYTVAISPNGKMLASGGSEDKFEVWDLATHKVIGKFENCPLVSQLAFSPDSKSLAWGGSRGVIEIWDIATRKMVVRIADASMDNYISALAFSPDGKVLASSAPSRDDAIMLWDVKTGKNLFTFTDADKWGADSLAFSPDGKLLAAGTTNQMVWLFRVAAGNKLVRIATLRGHIFGVAFSPDGKIVASGSYDNTVKLWDVSRLLPCAGGPDSLPIGEPKVREE
jgi:WD40 repeat protein